MTLMREYYYLKPQIPGMACSNIISQLTKVGKHIPEFPDIIKWVGIDGLRPEDWQPNEYQGKTYSSSALKIARALCKWIMAHPEDCENHLGLAMEWVDRVSETAKGNDALWLNKDKASLLRKMGDYQRSAELLSDVIKAKQNEFWVWAEAGRLYMSEQPDLALSCFCRALECPSDPKFLVGVHLELAELLAEKGEYAQASKEVLITIDIRLAQGWPIGREIESIIANPWYDSSAADAEESKDFYSKHSAAALALCFDAVETKAANYLGTLLPHSSKNHHLGRKPKPLSRFAFKDAEGHAWSLVGPGNKNMKVKVGAPVLIVVGQQNEDIHQTIINVSARPEGEHCVLAPFRNLGEPGKR